MARTKQTLRRAPPYDPHVARVAIRGQVRMVDETCSQILMLSQRLTKGLRVRSLNRLEEARTVRRRRRYMICSVLLDCPLGRYDANGNPLSRLGEPLELGLYHVLVGVYVGWFEQSSELEILDARSQGDKWVSPASTLFDEAFSNILASGLVKGLHCETPRRNYRAHRLPLGWLTWSECHIEHGAVLPLHQYFLDITAYFGMCSTQFTPKSVKYLSVMFILYRELGWPQPTPYKIEYYFDLKSELKQNRTGYFDLNQIGHQWLGDTNCTAMSKVVGVEKYNPVDQCGQFWKYGVYPLAPGVVGAPAVDGACLRDGHARDLDDE
uniref:Uncharacterized protein n=1 Tax=Cannabis sativa TaxID=3483 RepID=A0A803PSN3_CANSA